MSHSPAFLKKAASLIVIPCGPLGAYHTYDPAMHRSHTLKISAIGGYNCDCEAGSRGHACTHRIAVHWHRQEQNDQAAKAAVGAEK